VSKKNDSSVKQPEWKQITKPQRQFIPQQMLFGQARNFLVLESIEKRIWQLDSDVQVLSSMDVPKELKNSRLHEYQLFWTKGHRFTFVNNRDGTVLQYLENSGRLILNRKVKIPLSCKTCYLARDEKRSINAKEFPFICASANSLLAFDLFFSNQKTVPLTGDTKNIHPNTNSYLPVLILKKSGEKILKYTISKMSFCFQPEKREFSYCPEK
jgi:hypothetical protein